MMENHIPGGLLTRFIVEYEEDQIALLNEFKGDRQLHRNYVPQITFFAGDYYSDLEHPLGTGDSYTQYGIEGTLDEYVECPPIIKHVLKDEARINEAFVGSEEAYQRLDLISDQTELSAILTP